MIQPLGLGQDSHPSEHRQNAVMDRDLKMDASYCFWTRHGSCSFVFVLHKENFAGGQVSDKSETPKANQER